MRRVQNSPRSCITDMLHICVRQVFREFSRFMFSQVHVVFSILLQMLSEVISIWHWICGSKISKQLFFGGN